MFYIDIETAAVKAAEETHYQRMRCYVRKKIGLDSCNDDNKCVICQENFRQVSKLLPGIKNFLSVSANLERILKGKPDVLMEVNRDFWRSMFPNYDYTTWHPYFESKHHAEKYTGQYSASAKLIAEHIRQLRAIFNYSWFCDNDLYNAYHLTLALGRHTCTYCNRAYTHTVVTQSGKPIVRPTLDHWYFKAGHPLLAVSFYNLIPSCHACNSSAKGTELMDTALHTHPYVDVNQTAEFAFHFTYQHTTKRYRIFAKPTSEASDKAKRTFDAMNLEEIYNTHIPELTDILTIRQNYSGSYIKSLKKMLGDKLNTSDVYRIAFGTEYETADFYKRPLSKFKHDILHSIGLLNDLDE